MTISNKTYTIIEYGRFSRNKVMTGYQALPDHIFDTLENFILRNLSEGDGKIQELMTIASRKNVGKIISAKNHVGMIALEDGTVIEVLPKISGSNVTNEMSRKIFLEMLSVTKLINYKVFNTSTLKAERMSIFEVFIKMFVDEVDLLCKQGLKSAYISRQDNERFFRGKLLVNENIKHNRINKERFFVRYDEFDLNRPENRLIKSTLEMLMKLSNSPNTVKLIRKLLGHFESIPKSIHYDVDFSKCQTNRSMTHYIKALAWSRVFLMKKSFTSFSGENVAFSLLFPMEKLFEAYVADKLKRHLGDKGSISVQDKRFHMYDAPKPIFSLRPDIVIRNEDTTFVLDTKWKILSQTDRNYGISQSDIYQMYAYSKKYSASMTLLVYPKSFERNLHETYTSHDGAELVVTTIDLLNINESIKELIQKLI